MRPGRPRRQPPFPLWPAPKSVISYDGKLIGITNGKRKTLVAWDGSAFEPMADPIEAGGFIEFAVAAPDGAIWCVGYSLLLRWHPADGVWREYRDVAPPRLVDNKVAPS